EHQRERHHALLLRPASFAAPGLCRVRPVLDHPGRRPVDQRLRLGQVRAAVRLPLAVRSPVPVVPGGHPRKRERPVQPQDRPVVPLEHELVHLLGGDVLRRLLHRPVVDAGALGARARRPGQRLAVARLQGGVAHWRARRHRIAGRHRRAVPDHGPLAAADHQHGAAADVGRHADHRPPCAGGRQAGAHHPVDVDHRGAGRHLRRRAGLRVLPCLQRPQPEADLGRLRLHLLHADRLPRLPRDRRHADAAVHHAAADGGTLHPGEALRLRGRRLVLALRRRRVAGPVRAGVLAL
ncbi:MAG: Cytochrome c oxidase polypeptide III, partial [uncultured Ramlibacter sp.]